MTLTIQPPPTALLTCRRFTPLYFRGSGTVSHLPPPALHATFPSPVLHPGLPCIGATPMPAQPVHPPHRSTFSLSISLTLINFLPLVHLVGSVPQHFLIACLLTNSTCYPNGSQYSKARLSVKCMRFGLEHGWFYERKCITVCGSLLECIRFFRLLPAYI